MNEGNNKINSQSERRRFLSGSLKAAAFVGVSSAAPAAFGSALTAPVHGPERRIRLVNAHTWEKLDLVYWAEGEYLGESMRQINHLMRDHRADESTNMDPRLIDDLHKLYTLLDTDERMHILSGFRTKATNAKLRNRSNGVAKYSLHMEGRAADLSVPGRTAKQIQQAALTMKSGGVGYYASSGFVHIDTGKVRQWQQG